MSRCISQVQYSLPAARSPYHCDNTDERAALQHLKKGLGIQMLHVLETDLRRLLTIRLSF